jgi:hypothetical protein
MDILRKFFPFAFKYAGDTNQFVVGILIHVILWFVIPVIVACVLEFIGAFLCIIPIIGWILGPILMMLGALVSFIISFYGLAGLVINILVYTKVIKE